MITLSTYITENICPITQYNNLQSNEQLYESIFNKINIYNRNTRLINENKYRNLPTNTILFTTKEQSFISEMLQAFHLIYLNNYLSNNTQILEGQFIDENNNLILLESIDDIKGKIKNVINKIPEDVKNVYLALANIAKNGIKRVYDFIKTLGEIFAKLGDTLTEALKKLGFYNNDFVNTFEDTKSIDNLDEILKDNDNKTNRFLVSKVVENITNEKTLNSFNKVSESKITENDIAIYENLFTKEQMLNEGLLSFLKKIWNKLFGDNINKDVIVNTFNHKKSKEVEIAHTEAAEKASSEDISNIVQTTAKMAKVDPNVILKSADDIKDIKDESEVKNVMKKNGCIKNTKPTFFATVIGILKKCPKEKLKKVSAIITTAGATVAGFMGMGLLPITILIGGYTLYKGLDWAGPKLSGALGNVLYNDTTKKFVQNLYDDTILRYLIGLNTKLNRDDYSSTFRFVCAHIFNIIKMCTIAFLITMVIKLVAPILLVGICTAEVAAVVTAGILLTRNIVKTILNRILVLKRQEESGKEIKANEKFFDVMTLFSIIASIGTFVYSTEIGKKAINGAIKWLWDFGKDKNDTENTEVVVAAITDKPKSTTKEIKMNKDTIKVKTTQQDPVIKTKNDEILVRNPKTNRLHKPSLNNDNKAIPINKLPKEIKERDFITSNKLNEFEDKIKSYTAKCEYNGYHSGGFYVHLNGQECILNNDREVLFVKGYVGDTHIDAYFPISKDIDSEIWMKLLTISEGDNHIINMIMKFKAYQISVIVNSLNNKIMFNNWDKTDLANFLETCFEKKLNEN